jgi:hypothetical protein
MLSEYPLTASAASAPETLKGRASRTVKGWTKLLNWVPSTM